MSLHSFKSAFLSLLCRFQHILNTFSLSQLIGERTTIIIIIKGLPYQSYWEKKSSSREWPTFNVITCALHPPLSLAIAHPFMNPALISKSPLPVLFGGAFHTHTHAKGLSLGIGENATRSSKTVFPSFIRLHGVIKFRVCARCSSWKPTSALVIAIEWPSGHLPKEKKKKIPKCWKLHSNPSH